jgi:hypothetical protein
VVEQRSVDMASIQGRMGIQKLVEYRCLEPCLEGLPNGALVQKYMYLA